VAILGCAEFNSSNANKSVSSYVFSKACTEVNYIVPVFSVRWRDYHTFLNMMKQLVKCLGDAGKEESGAGHKDE
jgi:hypothetical protein